MNPQGKVKIKWSPDFAYAVGLIATDGNLSPSGRHIILTSKDLEQIRNFKKILGLKNKIGKKSNGSNKAKKYYVIQFGDVLFYSFLWKIGIPPAKSKILAAVDVPDVYFFDFLRGCFDGDGSSSSYFDPRWKNSFLMYVSFTSASIDHVNWLRKTIISRLGVFGHVVSSGENPCYQLRYAKTEAVKILRQMYKKPGAVCLTRKRLKINRSLAIMNQPPL